MPISKTHQQTQPNPMTEVNSASEYYQWKFESDSRLKAMSEEISRLNQEISHSNLAASLDKYVAKIGGNEDVSQFLFNQLKDSKIDIQSIPETVENIRDNLALKAFFQGTSIVPNSSPEARRFKQSWG